MQTSVRVDLLTLDMRLVGTLRGAVGGQITEEAGRHIPATGTLNLSRDTGEVEWPKVLVRPWRTFEGVTWPLGTMVATAPPLRYDGIRTSRDITLADRTSLLDQPYSDAYTVPTGTVVMDRIRDLIEWCGVDAGSLADSDETLRARTTWQPDTSALTIINDLLKAVGMRPLSCDGYGRYVVTPALAPTDTPISTRFDSGIPYSLTPTLEPESPGGLPPNEIITRSQGSGALAGQKGRAVNENPDDPYSLWVNDDGVPNSTRRTKVVSSDLNTTAKLNAEAARLLEEARMIDSVINLTHWPRDIHPHQAAALTLPEIDTYGPHLIRTVTHPLGETDKQQTQAAKVWGLT